MKVTNFEDYSEVALSTSLNLAKSDITYPVLGICGESGEVAEKIKKIIRDKGGVVSEQDKLEIGKELGDVLWYINRLAWGLGFSLREVAQLNIDKLLSRRERNVLSGSGDNR